MADDAPVLLELEDVETHLHTSRGIVRALDGVSLTIRTGEVVGLVGESGSGKSMTALSVLGLLPSPAGRNAGGRILYKGRDLLRMSPAELNRLRGNEISMVFQDPSTFLNPVLTIGAQIGEAVKHHHPEENTRKRIAEVLDLVGLPTNQRIADRFPHELSGGMRQRSLIAIALACRPQLLIADEPTTALDVTIQAQILDLLKSIQEEFGMSLLLITHDLGIVAEICDRLCVMYAGRILEDSALDPFYAGPMHPYSQGLLRSVVSIAEPGRELYSIEGTVPDLTALPSGCRFHPRCPHIRPSRCPDEPPLLRRVDDVRLTACHYAEEIAPESLHLAVRGTGHGGTGHDDQGGS